MALPRIPQPASYHNFASDHRTLAGIPHAPNVLSNAAISAAGLLGLAELVRRRGRGRSGSRETSSGVPEPAAPAGAVGTEGDEQSSGAGAGFGGTPAQASLWAAVFAAMVVAGAGSAYYHLAPSTPRLAADRFGMAITFALLAAAVCVDRRGWPAGVAGWALAGAGVLAPPATVLHWLASEAAGMGDLRWYALSQALSVAAVGYTALCYSPRGSRPTTTVTGLLSALTLYTAAVLCDRLDRPVYWLALGVVSGHTLKHLLAGAEGWQLVRMLRLRAGEGRRGGAAK